MWMFTDDPDASFLALVGRQKALWLELATSRLDEAFLNDSKDFELEVVMKHKIEFAVCCPMPESMGYFEEMSKIDLQSHILVPHGHSDGVFTSCNGELVQLIGDKLILRTSYAEERKVKIEDTRKIPLSSFLKNSSSFPPGMADNVVITIYRISRPLHGTLHAPECPDEMEYSVVEKYVTLLRSIIDAQPIFHEVDAYIEEVNVVASGSKDGLSNIHPSFSSSCCAIWEEATSKMVANGNIVAGLVGAEATPGVGGKASDFVSIRLGQVVESYLLHGISNSVQAWVKHNGKLQDSKMQSLAASMRGYTQSDLDIPPAFQTRQSKAIKELPKIKESTTPVDKLLVLKRCVGFIREAIDENVRYNYPDESDLEMSTDDLIMVIVWVLIRASVEKEKEKEKEISKEESSKSSVTTLDLVSEVRFISQFHFVSSPTSQLEFILCHFQVASGWIIAKAGPTTSEDQLGEEGSAGGGGAFRASSPVGGHSHADFLFAAETERSSSPRMDLGDDSKKHYASDGDDTTIDGRKIIVAPPILEVAVSLIESASASSAESAIVASNERASEDFMLAILQSSGHCNLEALNHLRKFRGNRELGLSCVGCTLDYSAAVSCSGDVYTWGTADSGRLGRNTTAEFDSLHTLMKPRVVDAMADFVCRPEVKGVVQAHCGSKHMVVLTEAGKVFAWGDNRNLQLGVTAKEASHSTAVAAVKLGAESILSLQHHGDAGEAARVLELRAMGCCGPVMVHALTRINVIMVACGAYHSMCLSDEGHVFSWGRTANGRLGRDVPEKSDNAPTQAAFASSVGRVECAEWVTSPVKSICAGHAHSVALTTSGEAYTWGAGLYGRLGHGCHVDRIVPEVVAALRQAQVKVASVSAGAAHTMFLEECGLLLGCGLDSSGQVAVSEGSVSSPSPSPSPSPFASSPSSTRTPPSSPMRQSEKGRDALLCPLPVDGMKAVKRVYCGPFHTIIETKEGGIVAFGRDCAGRKVHLDYD